MTVPEIFNKAQEGTGGHVKYAKILWSQQATNPEACWENLCSCMHYLMTIPPVMHLDYWQHLQPGPPHRILHYPWLFMLHGLVPT